MKTISLLFRSKKRKEHSVENVFANIEPYLKKEYVVNKAYLPEDRYLSPTKFVRNVLFTLSVKGDVIHVTGENYFCACFTPKNKTVLTILDYVAFENMTGVSKFLDWLFMYYIPIKRSKYVTCISDKVYEDTIRKFPWCAGKTKMIPVSISDDYQCNLKEFNKEKPIVLVIGSTPNKNITRIIQALSGVKCKLDIVGKLSEEQIHLLKILEIDYQNSYNISNKEVLKHYQECDLVCFASTYEGFGMPIVEAQAVGRPVVTSNIDPMRSVSGGAASLVDPLSVGSIHDGIVKIIQDDYYREKIIKDGLNNCQKYKNVVIAKEYIKMYQKV